MRARIGIAVAVGSLSTIALGGACEATNLGQPPPDDQFFFPSGLLLDPVDRTPAPVDVEAMLAGDVGDVVLPPESMDLPGPHFLFVANGNNDRTYNAGTLMAVDLREFWRAWYDPHRDDPAQAGCLAAIAAAEAELAGASGPVPGAAQGLVRTAYEACAGRDPRRGGLDPFCHEVDTPGGARRRCVQDPGAPAVSSEPDATSQCRRLPLLPHVVECDERSFERASVRVGDFAATLSHSIEGDTVRLWLPVRGDPSITYIDARVDARGDIGLDCDQRSADAPTDARLCGDRHRLDRLRNDPELDALDREPYNTVIWEREDEVVEPGARGRRLAFVAHSGGAQLSVVDLDGVRAGREPAIVDVTSLYTGSGGISGGFGLAVRPCYEAGAGPLGAADPEPNVPTITQGCRRPLVYSSYRFSGQLASFTASGLAVGDAIAQQYPPGGRPEDSGCAGADPERRPDCVPRRSCTVPMRPECTIRTALEPSIDAQGNEAFEEVTAIECPDGVVPSDCADGRCRDVYAGPYCATPDQLDQPCAVQCEPRVRGSRRILPSLLIDTSLGQASPILGDVAFADARGDQLLILQTNPGALLSLDTSLDSDGEPLDIPSSPPVEICAEPSRMKIYIAPGTDGEPAQRYALISCFRAALVYIVDLEALRVVDAVVVGTGPHDLAVDAVREVAYVINSLESSISVIDLSRRRPTRFQELARLGLQDPFTQ